MINHNDRICEVDGCGKLGQHLGSVNKDGTIRRRAKCGKHHSIKYGMGGWDYKIHRKTYCENIDGRLGFKCNCNITDPEWQLDVDHIDNNHENNDPSNLQTLCKNCHALKTRNAVYAKQKQRAVDRVA